MKMIIRHLFIIYILVGISHEYPAFSDRETNQQFIPNMKKQFKRSYDTNYNESEIFQRVNAWNSSDKQNIWELSGLFEGDIMLNHQEINTRNGLVNKTMRWPNGTIPYLIRAGDFDDEEIEKIHEGIEEFHEKTCLLFRKYDKKIDKDYVKFISKNPGCWSSVGKQGKEQVINLQSPCVKHGTIVHEILHALGFYHQQSAFDRDSYVKIHWENIQSGKEHNFNKYDKKTVTDFDVGYDYGSVLHYSSRAFSKNDEPTITPIEDGIVIGQRKGMSKKDIEKLQAMYRDECSARVTKETDRDNNDITDHIINFFPSLIDSTYS